MRTGFCEHKKYGVELPRLAVRGRRPAGRIDENLAEEGARCLRRWEEITAKRVLLGAAEGGFHEWRNVMSRESRLTAGVLLILMPTVVYGGVSILSVLIGDPQ